MHRATNITPNSKNTNKQGLEYLARAWANDFQVTWFIKGSSMIDLLSCLPIVEKAASLSPTSEMSLELTLLRSIRFLRIFRLLKSTAMIEDSSGRRRRSLGLSVLRILVSAVGTLSISAGLLWRVEGQNGINPAINSFGDACFYMLNVFTSQGAPFPVMSTQGRFVTAAAILIGLLSLPVQVSELLSLLRTMKAEDRTDPNDPSDPSDPSDRSDGATSKGLNGLDGIKGPCPSDSPTADSLSQGDGGFLSISVRDFCSEAGISSASLEPGFLDVEVGDFFTVLEDASTAPHIAPPAVRLKLLAALVRRKRQFSLPDQFKRRRRGVEGQ